MSSLVDSVTAAGEHRSPGFAALCSQLRPGGDAAVLDLGPASGANVAFFSEMGCRLHVSDLYRSLQDGAPRPAGDTQGFARACRELLPETDGSTFDYVLAWDLLNYLAPDEIEVLARYLTALCHPGTDLFTMISIRHQIPVRPLGYQILSQNELRYGEPARVLRDSPEYKEPTLLRLLPGFLVQRCFLLRNGMQEYLLRYSPSAP